MAPTKEGRKPPRKPRFREGDRVLCFHGPFLYTAECMKVVVKYRKVKYQVRYFGVKGRSSLKARVVEQLSNLSTPDSSQPSTSAAENSVTLPVINGSDAAVELKERPSPQAAWEDEWLPQSKLLKYNKANLRKLRELNKARLGQLVDGTQAGPVLREKVSAFHKKNFKASTVMMKKAKNIPKKIPVIGETCNTNGKPVRRRGRPPGRKRRGLVPQKKQAVVTYAAYSDSDSEPYPEFLRRNETKVHIPEELKPWLVDDWDMIVKQNQLFQLPAKKTVSSILEDYEHYEGTFGNGDNKWMEDVKEVVVGLKAYFNVMLGSQLLYKFERPQYAEILTKLPGVPMSHIYGAPHLLRLFVKIEEMFTYTPIEQQSLVLLLQHLHNFLNYLASNFSVLFTSKEYVVASPEYYRKTI